MSDLNLVRQALPTSVAECKALSERTRPKRGKAPLVGWITIYRIATGRTTNPGIETVEHIKRALAKA